MSKNEKLLTVTDDFTDEYVTVSRKHFTDFLTYLYKRDNPVIDSRRRELGNYCKYVVDYSAYAEKIVALIKEKGVTDDVYAEIARISGREVIASSDIRAAGEAFSFREDFYEYLLTTPLYEQADVITQAVSGGDYKKYKKAVPKEMRLSVISDELDIFARSVRFMPSREAVILFFKTEYERFEGGTD